MDRIAVAEWPISKFHLAAAAVSFFYLHLISVSVIIYPSYIWKEGWHVINEISLDADVSPQCGGCEYSARSTPQLPNSFSSKIGLCNWTCAVYIIPSPRSPFLLFSLSRLARDDASTHRVTMCPLITTFWTVAKAVSSLTYSCIYRPRWMGTQLHT